MSTATNCDIISILARRYRFLLSMFYLRSRTPLAVIYLPALVRIKFQLETAIEIDRMNKLIADKGAAT